jgi:5-(carboxyamino)imidazole ribonucleotide mutase
MATRVAIIIGSKSDEETMRSCWETLAQFKISYEVIIASAHRTPEKVKDFVQTTSKQGVEVFIAAAGGAAHLAGAVAAWTIKPVIGVPLPTSDIGGLDSLLSTVQMPPGVPVATVSLGKWGATNAAVLAAKILALHDEKLKLRLEQYYTEMKQKILAEGIIHQESFND